VAQTPFERLAFAVAQGRRRIDAAGPTPSCVAVAAAFPRRLRPIATAGCSTTTGWARPSCAALLVLSDREADPGDLTDALILLRSVGLEDIARRASLAALLDRR
jgi:hypothetical protein